MSLTNSTRELVGPSSPGKADRPPVFRMLLGAAACFAVIAGPLAAQTTPPPADVLTVSDCTNALEQLSALRTDLAAYKQLAGDHRQYLDDIDRPAEIARLQKVVAASCSTDRETRKTQEAAAERLRMARSPECSFERDKLLLMKKPGSRDPPDDVAAQRAKVASQCPTAPVGEVWLLQAIWPM